MSGSVRRKP